MLKHDFQVGDTVEHIPNYSGFNKGRGKVVALNAVMGAYSSLIEVEWDSNKRTKQGWRTISLVSRAKPNKAEPNFKAGDRVRLLFTSHEGCVVQDFWPTSLADKVLVKPDKINHSIFVTASRLKKIAPPNTFMDSVLRSWAGVVSNMTPAAGPRTIPFGRPFRWNSEQQQSLNNLHNGLVDDTAFKTMAEGENYLSEKYRCNPSMRKWETSYTKGIIEGLDALEKRIYGYCGTLAITKARNLLRGFWKDLHMPYEQRDAARAELEKARLENASLREIIANAQRALEHKA
jgi:hypothetical protein